MPDTNTTLDAGTLQQGAGNNSPALPPAQKTIFPTELEQRVLHTIREHTLLAAATSVIPVSFLDTAALAAVQLRLLNALATLYGQEFRKDLGLSAIGTLLSTVGP